MAQLGAFVGSLKLQRSIPAAIDRQRPVKSTASIYLNWAAGPDKGRWVVHAPHRLYRVIIDRLRPG